MTDLPEPEPSNCSLLHDSQMSNKTTKDPEHPYCQCRPTTNPCPHRFNLRFSFCCSVSLALLVGQSLSEAPDFPLTVIRVLKALANYEGGSTTGFGILSPCLDISKGRMKYLTHRPENTQWVFPENKAQTS